MALIAALTAAYALAVLGAAKLGRTIAARYRKDTTHDR